MRLQAFQGFEGFKLDLDDKISSIHNPGEPLDPLRGLLVPSHSLDLY